MSHTAALTKEDSSIAVSSSTEKPFAFFAPLPIGAILASMQITFVTPEDFSASFATRQSTFLAALMHADGAVFDHGTIRIFSFVRHQSTACERLALLAVGSVHHPPHILIRPPVTHRTSAVTAASSELGGLLLDSLAVLNEPTANII